MVLPAAGGLGRRDGIHPAGMPGVATGDAFDGQKGAAQESMALVGLRPVGGTAGIKPAG